MNYRLVRGHLLDLEIYKVVAVQLSVSILWKWHEWITTDWICCQQILPHQQRKEKILKTISVMLLHFWIRVVCNSWWATNSEVVFSEVVSYSLTHLRFSSIPLNHCLLFPNRLDFYREWNEDTMRLRNYPQFINVLLPVCQILYT